MATPAFESAVPAPMSLEFSNGELAISPVAGLGSIPVGTTYLARSFNLRAGRYTFKLGADDAASLWLGSEMASIRRVTNTIPSSNLAASGQMFLTTGTYRIDIILRNIALSPAYAVLSIWKDGTLVYASSAAGWMSASAPIPDAQLPSDGDPRLLLPVFSLTPNWQAGITERLWFKTEVFTSETGAEQRRSILRNPRRSFEASFMRHTTSRMRLDTFITGVGSGPFLVPLWHEQFRMPEPLGQTEVLIQFPQDTLRYREFFVGDLAMLSNGDPDVYEVVKVAAVDHTLDVLELDHAPTIDWPAGTRITPLQPAFFNDMPSQALSTDRLGSVSARFELVDSCTTIEPSWGYCAPLWRFRLERREAIGVNYARNVFTLDVGSTTPDVVDPGQRTRIGMRGALKLFGRQKVRAFRSFITMARGRTVRFWMPSMSHDVEPVGTIGGTTFLAEPMGFSEFMEIPQDARVMLTIEFNDGRPPLYRKILSVEGLGADDAPYRVLNERFTVDQAIPVVTRAEIERISFIMPMRFDQDAFEIHHNVSDGKASSAAVVMMSAESTGMPPIDCWATSWTYPVIETDSLDVGFTLVGSNSNGIPPIVESVDTTMGLLEASLQDALKNTEFGPESLDVVLGILSGTITEFLYTDTEFGPEEVNAVLTPMSAQLVRALISHPIEPESINASLALTGATLS